MKPDRVLQTPSGLCTLFVDSEIVPHSDAYYGGSSRFLDGAFLVENKENPEQGLFLRPLVDPRIPTLLADKILDGQTLTDEAAEKALFEILDAFVLSQT